MALNPTLLDGLIRNEIADVLNRPAYDQLRTKQVAHREELKSVSDRWTDVVTAIQEDRL